MPDSKNNNTTRLNGLDNLRALAIISVLLYHYSVVVSHSDTFGAISRIGWAGVDLFFVLSGYLISNQLLYASAREQQFSLTLFYLRRLLRTLPNYYFVLALYLLFPLTLGGKATASLWHFLTFTQNFNLHYGETFSQSWSLCIGEHFYLIYPLIVLLALNARKAIAIGWIILITAVIAGICARGYIWLSHGGAAMSTRDFSEHIYYSTFTRLDEFLPGVIIAMFKNLNGKIFGKLVRQSYLMLIIGLLGTGSMLFLFDNFGFVEGYGYSFVMTTFGYTLLAMSLGALVMSALNPQSLINRVKIPGAATLALWSYAIYLIHKPVYKILADTLHNFNIDTNSTLSVVVAILISVISGMLMYKWIEAPVIKLRDQYFPSIISARLALSKPIPA